MANASKNKGDRAEREAVELLKDLVPHLVLPKAKRMLGAGRMEDVGDLHVFGDVAIQVRCYKLSNIGGALRSAALDSVVQADNGDCEFGLGMVPYPGGRAGSVRWFAAVTVNAWPDVLPVEPIEFKIVSKALVWLRDDDGPYGYEARSRTTRIALLTGPAAPVLVAPIEAWLSVYDAKHPLKVAPVPLVEEDSAPETLAG